MKPWKNLADLLGVPLSDPDRVAATLDALEQSFRPLTGQLPHDAEPAPAFRPVERSDA
jgi:hypothetical protein